MSRSPNDNQDRQAELPDAFSALGRMLQEGRSFSGRERNCCFLNTLGSQAANGRFANISAVSGIDFPDDGRAVAQVDWDHDGDLDLWISNRNAPRLRFLRNDLSRQGHFLAVKLVGNGNTTNRDAVGARVEVVVSNAESGNGNSAVRFPNSKITKSLRAGEGFLAQSSKWLHFGLGDSKQVAKVIVHWPNGDSSDVEEFGPLEVDQRYQLEQGTGAARDVSVPERSLKLTPSQPKAPSPTDLARLPLLVRLPMPIFKYDKLDGERQALPIGKGQAVLVCLYSSSCRPCLEELSEFGKRESELRASGIEIVALSVDSLQDKTSDSDDARRLLTRIEFPFPAGVASYALVSYFQRLHTYHSPLVTDFPMPTSFLIDQGNRLAFIYKGRVSVDQLLLDVEDQVESQTGRFERAAALAGRSIQHPVVTRKMTTHEVRIRFQLAEAFREANRLDAAIGQYSQILKLDPRLAKAYNNLGLTFRQQGNLDKAKDGYQHALLIDPNSAEIHNNLGVVLLKQGQTATAKNHFHRARHINPDYVDAEMNLGVIAKTKGDFEQAANHFQRALEINPKFAKAEFQLGTVAERQRRLAVAATHYQNAIRIEADYFDAHVNLGVVFARLGNLVKGKESLERALQINPSAADAHNNLGLLLESEGKLEQAKTRYERALRIDPSYQAARRNLMHVQALIGRKQK